MASSFREIRKSIGISQYDVAKAFGVSVSTVSRQERFNDVPKEWYLFLDTIKRDMWSTAPMARIPRTWRGVRRLVNTMFKENVFGYDDKNSYMEFLARAFDLSLTEFKKRLSGKKELSEEARESALILIQAAGLGTRKRRSWLGQS